MIEELDIGQPELTDIVLKTVTSLDSGNTIEFLGIYAPEEYTRDIYNVLESPDFEDVALIDTEQDLYLTGLTWRRLVGVNGEWTRSDYSTAQTTRSHRRAARLTRTSCRRARRLRTSRCANA